MVTSAGSTSKDVGNYTTDEGLKVCAVSAVSIPGLDREAFLSVIRTFPREPASASVCPLIEALDNILRREAILAEETAQRTKKHPPVVVHGNKFFDFRNSPAWGGKTSDRTGVELRRGIMADTRFADGHFIRATAPCLGLFFQSMNLADFIHDFYGDQLPSHEDVEHVLKGLKIRKRGEATTCHLAGVDKLTPKTRDFDWAGMRITVADYFNQRELQPSFLV